MATVDEQWPRLHAVPDKAAVAAPVERKYAIRDHLDTALRWIADKKNAENTPVMTHNCLGQVCTITVPSAAPPRRLDCGDVYLFHWHHRFERALGRCGIAIG